MGLIKKLLCVAILCAIPYQVYTNYRTTRDDPCMEMVEADSICPYDVRIRNNKLNNDIANHKYLMLHDEEYRDRYESWRRFVESMRPSDVFQ